MGMRILWVKPGKLLPLDTGGKLRTYNILRHLSAAHDVTYLSHYDGVRDERYEEKILQHLPGAIPVWTGNPDVAGVVRYIDYIFHLAGTAPYAVRRFRSSRVQRLLRDWLVERKFDVAVCDFLVSAQNFPSDFATPTVLFQHNVESELWKRRVQFASNWAVRLVSKIEYAKMTRYEKMQVGRFYRVIAVSETDRQTMRSMVDAARIAVIPTGVDLGTYSYDPALRPSHPLVVFVGSMDWEPNIDGVEYFCREIWPRVLAHVPEARFRIVGRNPHSKVKKLASSSVEVTGSVPSVINHLREAAVVVVPLRIGGGTRIKIYEAMAMGKATVSTRVGAEGLDVRSGRDLLLADEPDSFAECVIKLLTNENVRREYEAAAAAAVRQYDWSVITEQFVEELQKTMQVASADQEFSAQVMLA
jgi:polysaccharide biosynthesis protein PslH